MRGCAVSRMYIHVCNCDIFSVVYLYLDHLNFCVVCIIGRSYGCCSERNIFSNECNNHTSCLGQPIGTHGDEVATLGALLRVCMLRECKDARVTTMLVWGMDEVWLW